SRLAMVDFPAPDNPVNQMFAVAILEKKNHSVRIANNGQEALDLLAKECFDAVLMDIQMPVMDGLEATRQIREREKSTGKHIPIVAMTAHAMQKDKDECFAVGMDYYASKPIRTEHLFEILDGIPRVEGPSVEQAAPGQITPTLTFGKPDRGRTPLTDTSVFNRAEALEQCLESEDMLTQLARVFLANADGMLDAVANAIKAGDAKAVHHSAHTFKGAVGNLAAKKSHEAALRLEQMGRLNDIGSADEAFNQLKESFYELKVCLHEFEAETV
ncbi:MAG: response regulator, partial [bacterium]